MREILLSIKPHWCNLIASGEKKIEARKTKPNISLPFKVYIYCTKDEPLYHSGERYWCGNDFGNGKVIGEFVCDKLVCVISHPEIFAKHSCLHLQAIKDACLTNDEAEAYSNGKDLFGWHISELKLYDEPLELKQFRKYGFNKTIPLKRPPQSWCYVERIGVE